MLEKREVIIIICDCCGDVFDGLGEGGYTVYEDDKGAWDALECTEWVFERAKESLVFCDKECEKEYKTSELKPNNN